MSAIDIANAEQRAASDPGMSAFVAASAGSGKTKLLTDRLLRLMLSGTPPEKILCLTYTKAAAAEMVLRLNRRLGDWVVMEAAALAAELRGLDVAADAKHVALARKLFADVLDLPGGMRIGTIHAFCQSLLRRFPLEAALSPHFEVADDVDAAMRLREARETVLADPLRRDAIYALAAESNEQDFAGLTAMFANAEYDTLQKFSGADVAAMQRAALGAGESTHEALRLRAVALAREVQLRSALQRIHQAGTPSGRAWAFERLSWLAHEAEHRVLGWAEWVAGHFTTSGERRKMDRLIGKGLADEAEALTREIALECERIEAAEEAIKAARLAVLNAELISLATPILQNDQTQKNLAARLSYGDLIRFTGKLLIDFGAAWILYKLDGGIEHLLLDEMQDTAPAQWEIAYAIAEEFFAGAGAREQHRTIFAVGDAKQSIFSFQGADLRSFQHYQVKFRGRVRAAGQKFLDGSLSVSFRSTAPVLALVDAVFAEGPAREGVCLAGAQLRHVVSRAGQAGCVTLWPLTQAQEAAALPDWAVPEDYTGAESSAVILAREIAAYIEVRLAAGALLPSRNRKVLPGDFLILVRKRDALVGAVTAALKVKKIPVAGLDRLVLTQAQAVSDLLALCDALLLPEDDLAFGQFLASPLGGLSDASLMELALGRSATLLAALYRRADESPDWAAAKKFFEHLRSQVDFLSPFALLSEALGPLGGRARLLRRLGEEAAEPIDELLAEALAFAQRAPGSLQVFLHELRQSGAMVKREAEAGGGLVRIMTVHGAKGLQAPIVILPDTASLPEQRQKLFWLDVPQQNGVKVPVFCPRGALRSAAVGRAVAAQSAAAAEEYNRLLYVALTRAEDELIICGAEGRRKIPETSWYASVRAGFARLGAAAGPDGRMVLSCAQESAPDKVSEHAVAQIVEMPVWAGAAPGWVAAAPARETARPERLAPSRGVEDAAKRAIAASPLGAELAQLRGARAVAMEKGRATHALLQHLPELPPEERRGTALRYVAGISELAGLAERIVDSVLAVLAEPALQALFGPESRAEVPLAGVVGEVEIGGLVDRLAVTATEVVIADYKTDRAPPADVAGIPEKYLGQLAAYKAILAQIYPKHDVRCLLIWTESAQVMHVPREMLARYEPA